MNTKQIINNISSGQYDKQFIYLYQSAEEPRKRYIKALKEFESLFPGRSNVHIFSAPGRTEIGGNHTDHQHGSVLAASVDLDIVAVVSENQSNFINVKSEEFDMDTVDINYLEPFENEAGMSASLIRGVCSAFAKNNVNIRGFDAYTVSNVLKGSGLSSSAAFEVLIAEIINKMFGENKMSATQMAKICQYAENVYFKKPSGLLDQMASACGSITFADFSDLKNPAIENIDFNPLNFGYNLIIVNTGGDHANLTNDYADITTELKQISSYFKADVLRFVDEEDFYFNIPSLREKFGDRSVLRAIHFFEEQKRVSDQRKALETGDFKGFLNLVTESGISSGEYLQNLYSVSDVSSQGLMLAIALTRKFLKGKGACRVHGGGFAGTIQCYIPCELTNEYCSLMEKVFGEGCCFTIKIRPVGGYELKI